MIQIHGINPQQAHAAIMVHVWPWVKAQTAAGHAVVLEARLHEDAKSDQQRRFYHGVILTQIAKQAKPNGQTYPLAVWKEYFRNLYLGKKRVTTTNPLTGKKSRRHVRQSTEALGVKSYNLLIERVTAYAVTELGVEFDQHSPNGAIDPDTGEVYQ
ncbi:MAG: hypothetical protein COW02_03370 [Comamonadaceae bacterium CG12_big_fil_rev_8_21_14_0_65_59_15]|nr:MAG: hypothetical protein COW02_03370 [Comamonadaceae bacterium CG12_big_fil_rev_8_21_14_0_65_59_15]